MTNAQVAEHFASLPPESEAKVVVFSSNSHTASVCSVEFTDEDLLIDTSLENSADLPEVTAILRV